MDEPDLVVDDIEITIPDDLVLVSEYDGSLSEFTCGNGDLDEFIWEQAREYSHRQLGETWLLCGDDELLAYYTLAPASVNNEEYTGDESSEMENLEDFHLPVPALHLARLGVADAYQGSSIGGELIDYIIIWAENQAVPFWMIEVVSKEESIEFYKRLNFVTSGCEENEEDHTTMYYPLANREE